MELMLVVAVIVIMFGVGVPAVRAIKDKLEFKKANEIAKELFMVAQNYAIHMNDNGSLNEFKNSVSGSQSVVVMPSDYKNSNNGVNTAKYKNLSAINSKQAGPISYLVPEITQNTLSGNYIIEINPRSGDVYGVFYSEKLSANDLVKAYQKVQSSGASNDSAFRDAAARKENFIGYYGGYEAGLSMEGNEIKVKAYNAEQLYVTVDIPGVVCSKRTQQKLLVDFVISDEHGNKIIRSSSNSGSGDLTTPIFTTENIKRKSDNTIVSGTRATLILDDCLNDASGKHKFSELNKGLTLGDDITVLAQASYIDSTSFKYLTTETSCSTNAVTVNSLFEDGTEINDTSKNGEIKISNCRHLRNLDRGTSGFRKSPTLAERRQLVNVKQTADIDFNKSAVLEGVAPACKTSGLASSFKVRNSYPVIVHEYIFGTNITNYTDGNNYANLNNEFDGQGNEIKNLYVYSNAKSGTGLFGKYNCKISNVHLRDVKIETKEYDPTAAENQPCQPCTGALIGNAAGGHALIDHCGVYCTSVKESTSSTCDFVPTVLGEECVGGLVGRINAGSRITNSFAAIPVTARRGNAGGLVGRINDKEKVLAVDSETGTLLKNLTVAIRAYLGGYFDDYEEDSYNAVVNCYASGNVTGKHDVGGICGSCQGGVKNCYSTSIIYSTTGNAGGIVGKLWDCGMVTDCTFYGKMTGDNLNKSNSGVIADRAHKDYDYITVTENGKEVEKKVNCQNLRMDHPLWKACNFSGNTYLRMSGYNDNLFYGVLYCTTGYDGNSNTNIRYLNTNTIKANQYSALTRNINNKDNRSFPYDRTLRNETFPFQFISTIGYHYGDWWYGATPVETPVLLPTLAYYELYTDNSVGLSYLSLNTDEGTTDIDSTVKNNYALKTQSDIDGGVYVKESGYAVIVEGSNNVSINEKAITLNNNLVNSLKLQSGGTAEVYALPADYQTYESTNKDNFYTGIKLDDTQYYYNPHLAAAISTTNNLPSDRKAYIRTAKQFNNLGLYPYLWSKFDGKQITYEQPLDIRYDKYTDGSSLKNKVIGKAFDDLSFQNNYDGKGNEIVGYNLIATSKTGNRDYGDEIGVFGRLDGGTISNTHLVGDYSTNVITANFSETGEEKCAVVGGLVGAIRPGSTVSNSSVSGYSISAQHSETIQDNYVLVGGITGDNKGNIVNCSAANKELYISAKSFGSAEKYVGRIKILIGGVTGGWDEGTLENCYAGGDIYVKANTVSTTANIAYLAGISAGDSVTYGGTPTVDAKNCYSYCNIIDTYDSKNKYPTVYTFGGCPTKNDSSGITLGAVPVDMDTCYYLENNNKPQYNGATMKDYDEMIGLASPKADISYPINVSDNYPFKAVVTNSSGKYVHYGDWPADTVKKLNGKAGIIRRYKSKGNTLYELCVLDIVNGKVKSTTPLGPFNDIPADYKAAVGSVLKNNKDWVTFWNVTDESKGTLKYGSDNTNISLETSAAMGISSVGNTADDISVPFNYNGNVIGTATLGKLKGLNGKVGIIRRYYTYAGARYEMHTLNITDGVASDGGTKSGLTDSDIPAAAKSELTKRNQWAAFWSVEDDSDGTLTYGSDNKVITMGDGAAYVGTSVKAISLDFKYNGEKIGTAKLGKRTGVNGTVGIIRQYKQRNSDSLLDSYKFELNMYTIVDGVVDESSVHTYRDITGTGLEEYLGSLLTASACRQLVSYGDYGAFCMNVDNITGEISYGSGSDETEITTPAGLVKLNNSRNAISVNFNFGGESRAATLDKLKINGYIGLIRQYKVQSGTRYQLDTLRIIDGKVTEYKELNQTSIPTYASSAYGKLSNNSYGVFWSEIDQDNALTFGKNSISAGSGYQAIGTSRDAVSTSFNYDGDSFAKAELHKLLGNGTMGIIRRYKSNGKTKYQVSTLVMKDGCLASTESKRYDTIPTAASSASGVLTKDKDWCVFWSGVDDTSGVLTYGSDSVKITTAKGCSKVLGNTKDKISVPFSYYGTLGTASLSKFLNATVGIIRKYNAGILDIRCDYTIIEIVDGEVASTNTYYQKSLDNLPSDLSPFAINQLIYQNDDWATFWYGVDDTTGLLTYGDNTPITSESSINKEGSTRNAISATFKYDDQSIVASLDGLLSGTVGIVRRKNAGLTAYQTSKLIITNSLASGPYNNDYDGQPSPANLSGKNAWCVYWTDVDRHGGKLEYSTDGGKNYSSITTTSGAGTSATSSGALSVMFRYNDRYVGTVSLNSR